MLTNVLEWARVDFTMQVTLGNVVVAGVVLIVGRIMRVLGDALGKNILHELKILNSRASWIDILIKRYPDPEVLLQKLAKINGHVKEEVENGK